MREIYLDNSATTRPYDDVIDYIAEIYKSEYGNPSSKHAKGLGAEGYLKQAKETIAKIMKASEKEILFTSGGTESDNTALIGGARACKRRGNHLITTSIEHPAILQTMKFLESEGFEITYLPVDKYGIVSIDALKNALRPETILVSIMHTNNEIGTLQPLEEIGKIVKAYNNNILFHTDAVQGFGKFKIIPKKLNIDLMSVSGHKLHGPKGMGFLYIKEGVRILPYIYGGGQQGGMRSGTENVPAIAGLAKAIKNIYENLDEEVDRLYALKQRLIEGLLNIEDVKINGVNFENAELSEAIRATAPHIVSASFKDARAEVLLHALEEKGIYVSSGSACASNKNTVSDTLSAINIERQYLDSTIRFSFSVFNTEQDVDDAIEAVKEILPELRKYKRH